MQFRAKQIAPPKDWVTFENLCHAIFKVVWKDPLAQKNGRLGQAQHGVDVFNSPTALRGTFHGVQCKGKEAAYGSKPTITELRKEILKAEGFKPALTHWIFATTAPSDAVLQQAAREISVARRSQGKFTVDVLGWDEILALLAEAPNVIEEFYPEHSDNMPAVLETLRALPSRDETARLIRAIEKLGAAVDLDQTMRTRPRGAWQAVLFDRSRDLGPALLGLPLGPSDAVACPRLLEADMLVAQLKTAFAARIVGEPGVGKSIGSYQAALTLTANGYEVLRLDDPQARDIRLEQAEPRRRRLFLIDDAHLMPSHVLKALEQDATADSLVLSTHSASEKTVAYRGSIVVDPKRAVKTIAAALRGNLPNTLRAVRRADDQIGEHMLADDLVQRIDHAENTADRPWQFCFILGGGWRRAGQAADSARAARADIVLAVVALHQLASRDARTPSSVIAGLCRDAGMEAATVHQALTWLKVERLILSTNDCRCPHQRFAAVVLKQILAARDKEERLLIGTIANNILGSKNYPLAGLRVLLHELRFPDPRYVWAWLVQSTTVSAVAARCWEIETGEERLDAALTLVELAGYSTNWSRDFIADHVELFARWISESGNSGYGLGQLLTSVSRADADLAKAIVSASDPVAVAQSYSQVTTETVYAMCELALSIRNVGAATWNANMLTALDRAALLQIVERWTFPEHVSLVSRLCYSMTAWDEDLALTMVERFVPAMQRALTRNAFEGFESLDDLPMHVLRIFDPLRVFIGQHRPDKRRWAIGRSMCATIDPATVASQLSTVRKRDFQTAASFLIFLSKCSPKKFLSVVSHVDWTWLASAIGDDWANLPHETEVLLGVLSSQRQTQAMVTSFLAQNLDRIVKLPPRLALIAPEVAIQHIERGREIRLASHHMDWRYGGIALAVIADTRPELVEVASSPYERNLTNDFSAPNSSFIDGAALFIWVLRNRAPQLLTRVLTQLNVDEAERGLADCFAKGGEPGRAAALLVDAALEIPGKIGDMAKRLRTRFPAASRPSEKPPIMGFRRAGRSRTKQ